MAPLKFEEHIKDKLDKREIQPSARAWEHISSQLSTRAKRHRNNFLWYGVAASVAGLIVLNWIFLADANDIGGIKNTVVDTDKTIKEVQLTPDIKREPIKNEVMTTTKKEPTELKDSSNEYRTKILNNEKIQQIAILDSSKQYLKNVLWKTSEEVVEAKIAAVVAEVDEMQQENYTVTESDIDAMLRKAQQEILVEKYMKESNSVDATALLIDVEDELEQSFRDHLFETLKNGFLKVRTAVADRNK
ncbi:hypothetical protein U1E44_11665 [Arenibacter sp. GZD96]|uniref:hypothetical protein n=1 Tax=Aurantibrevibacter litoralis TaxID=3106030 RepID=UPI002AFF40CF|nr:hypothetical protein [Arenibacter sp. GZD-96]MEA1786753.1 hypothetical protein [Arenibacter sp. GZD-96]